MNLSKFLVMIGSLCILAACGTRDYEEEDTTRAREVEENGTSEPEATPVSEPEVIPVSDSSEETDTPSRPTPVVTSERNDVEIATLEDLPQIIGNSLSPLKDPENQNDLLDNLWWAYVVAGGFGNWAIVRLTDDRTQEQRAVVSDSHVDLSKKHPIKRKIDTVGRGEVGQAIVSTAIGAFGGLCALGVSRLFFGDNYEAFYSSLYAGALVGVITSRGIKRLQEKDKINFLKRRWKRTVVSFVIGGASFGGTYLLLVDPEEDEDEV